MSFLGNLKSLVSNLWSSDSQNNPQNSDMSSHVYTIGGVYVEFPHKAYGAQMAIMDKVIRGCNSSRNCLVESPTGSGKTLALLCSALAWQKREKENVGRQNEEIMKEYYERCAEMEARREELERQGAPKAETKSEPPKNIESTEVPNGGADVEIVDLGSEGEYDDDDDDEDVFKSPQKKKKKMVSLNGLPMPVNADQAQYDLKKTNDSGDAAAVTAAIADMQVPKPKRLRAPKIYFGTRTHKQIEQIIHELKKTTYAKNIRMTILSSREHTCVNGSDVAFADFGRKKKPQRFKNKTEMCRELLDPKQGTGCMYKTNVDKTNSHGRLEKSGYPQVWDIEEFVSHGARVKSCPYFAARDLSMTADIIFCPYNYLIHPLIRKSMEINLRGEIMILDEAHNIEDVCRDSSSYSVNLHDLTNFMQECERAAMSNNLRQQHNEMRDFIKLMVDWINDNTDKVQHLDDFNSGSAVWSGIEILASFENAGITAKELERFGENAAALDTPVDPKDVDPTHISISSASKQIYDGLLDTLPYIFNEQTRSFFRVLLDRKMDSTFNVEYEEPEGSPSGWVGRSERRSNFKAGWKYSLSIACLHPAVAFKHLNENLRSVILTSGTLSPIESFQSELGAEFPIKLEAAHVIDKSQVWIGALSCGPKQIFLESTYQKTATYDFQDELGRVILGVCEKVPYGVLCFFSSYTLLEKLLNRWESTGLTDEISEHKHILSEPRRMDELAEVMDRFYRCVEDKGALFLAVFRGKVSEGINFSDNYARCVISVGIPYPNARDNLVKLKKTFNNEFRLKNNEILSGDKWYQIQAYRALNQALGRCIRHKNDWGAILLIDHRFSKKHNVEGLSKWIKNMIGYYPEWNGMISSISNFTERQLQRTQVDVTMKEEICLSD